MNEETEAEAPQEATLIYEPSETKHWRKLFPKKTQLLGSHNLNPGEEIIAEIADVKAGTIKDKKGREEDVPMMSFRDTDDGTPIPDMVLNITNTKRIASLYGEQYDGWIGKCIQIHAVEVKAFGEMVMALRVRPTKPVIEHDFSKYELALRECTTMNELQEAFTAIPNHIKTKMIEVKDEMKGQL